MILQDKATYELVCQKQFCVFFNLKTSSAADRHFHTDRRIAHWCLDFSASFRDSVSDGLVSLFADVIRPKSPTKCHI